MTQPCPFQGQFVVWVIASYLLYVSHFELPHLHLGVIPFKFHWDLRHQKTRVPGLLCSIICMIPGLAILIQFWHVTHTHTTMPVIEIGNGWWQMDDHDSDAISCRSDVYLTIRYLCTCAAVVDAQRWRGTVLQCTARTATALRRCLWVDMPNSTGGILDRLPL